MSLSGDNEILGSLATSCVYAAYLLIFVHYFTDAPSMIARTPEFYQSQIQ
jgi:hypothetical protein